MHGIFDAINRGEPKLLEQELERRKEKDPEGVFLEINLASRNGKTTPLNLCLRSLNPEILQVLLEYGADAKQNSITLLCQRTKFVRNDEENALKSLDLLLEHGANPNSKDIRGNTLLHNASKNSYCEIVERLLKIPSIDFEIENYIRQTPIDVATDEQSKTMLLFKIHQKNESKFKKSEAKYLDAKLEFESVKPDFENDRVKFRETEKLVRKIQIGTYKDDVENKRKEIECVDTEITMLMDKLNKAKARKEDLDVGYAEAVNAMEDLLKKEETAAANDEKDKLSDNLFECPVCFAVPRAPKQILLCANGHSVCSDCRVNLQRCPVCRVGMRTIGVRNFALEALIAKSMQ